MDLVLLYTCIRKCSVRLSVATPTLLDPPIVHVTTSNKTLGYYLDKTTSDSFQILFNLSFIYELPPYAIMNSLVSINSSSAPYGSILKNMRHM